MEDLIVNPCVICLSNEATYKNVLCAHKLICSNCILDVIYKNQIPTVCYICKHKVILSGNCLGAGCSNNHIPLDCNVVVVNNTYPSCDTCSLFMTLTYKQRKHLPEWFRNYKYVYQVWEKSNIIYYPDNVISRLCQLLLKCKEYKNWNSILCSFLEQHKFLKYVDNRFYMLSIKHVDEIFDSMINISDTKDKHIILNLVKLCSCPWELSREKYGDALCYHGNFGISPVGLEPMKIIEKNIVQYIDKLEPNIYINSITGRYYTELSENTHI